MGNIACVGMACAMLFFYIFHQLVKGKNDQKLKPRAAVGIGVILVLYIELAYGKKLE